MNLAFLIAHAYKWELKQVNPVEHRLELRKYGDINIIDDAYNSNPVGSKMALRRFKINARKENSCNTWYDRTC